MTTPEFPSEPSVSIREGDAPLDIFKTVWTTKYADFKGRARRAEFWWFGVINLLVWFALGVGAVVASSISESIGTVVLFVALIYWLAVIVPSLAVTVRRLHDTNKSGWMLLIGLIPLVGPIVLLVFYFIDGDRVDNQYGPSPKYVS